MMMNPASSSDNDSSSCPSSSDEDASQKNSHSRNDGPEPVDSSDDNSDDEDSEDEEDAAQNISNFDDLPTDDSEDESDSDSDSDDSAIETQHAKGNSDYNEGNSDNEDMNQDDVPLSERVASQAKVGRRYYTGEDNNATNQQYSNDFNQDAGGKKKRVERKSRAIELASVRLKEARKNQKSNEDESDDGSVEQSNNNNNNNDGIKPKKSKHAPTEMSSKRRDYFARGRPDLNSSGIGVAIGANKYKSRDPRMESLSGHLDDDTFDKRYGFLEEVQDKEIDQLKLRVNAWKKSGKKGQKERKRLGIIQDVGCLEDDQEELTRLTQERAERNRAKVVRGAKHAVKQKIREDVASGKRGAYYPKKSELKRMEAEAKYEEIRKRGGDDAVDKAISKRRKKNLSKAAKLMPSHMAK
mmetsp:Transcript_22542/g.41333  ORF Transcript_22542/g.41333 Transcript_22542/m.41333 type:complete len:411 (-) Transcript_22542:259-1491(-)|eukprot:CAMPEP_0201904160 /NCGR_PEP_ID=MMETSP0902-20130614/55855_1 /ASSEMBLY_ACC=CAM_ASM_000551 /TAXON_ID=420261 /ORGANISM="Thalassiosira antarctica, Strain CCMP982" /LENGTH=410 /DNA_ID=CAMNT_0048438239 /DNA_START=27 /DNA_END=1259 /DNA_ORIENTATION=-